MNKLYTLLCILVFTAATNAQRVVLKNSTLPAQVFNKTYYTGFEDINNPHGFSRKAHARYPYKIAGTTTYDLQTNSAVCNRLGFTPNGNLVATWTLSKDGTTAFGDRGSGYNVYTNGAWGADPAKRIESLRTGWPNIAISSDGRETVVAHNFTSPNYSLVVNTKPGGSNVWAQSKVPSATPVGVLWPRATIGGADGKTVHVIAITTPEGTLGGAAFEEVNGHVVYFRSKDGGLTWDKKDVVIPGLDKTDFAAMDSDAYSIAARGNTVAVLIQTAWNDIAVYKSTDNGDTWKKTIIRKFPLSKYVFDTEYTLQDIGGVDTSGPAGTDPAAATAAMLAMYTTDGTGNLTIDSKNNVHVFWGEMYVTDDTPGDAQSSFYPGWFGIGYWNESYGANNYERTAFGPIDENGDNVLNITSASITPYGNSLTAYPSAVSDDAGNVFLAYASVSESNISVGGETYRHILLTSSADGGKTWTDPYDVINSSLFPDPADSAFYHSVEAMYPNLAVRGNELHLVYQQDYEPGHALLATPDPVGENEIAHLVFDKRTLVLIEVVKKAADFKMSVTPNPSADYARLSFTLAAAKDTKIEIMDINGAIVTSKNLGNLTTGSYTESLDIQSLVPGAYFVKLTTGKFVASTQLIKQ